MPVAQRVLESSQQDMDSYGVMEVRTSHKRNQCSSLTHVRGPIPIVLNSLQDSPGPHPKYIGWIHACNQLKLEPN